MFKMKIVDWLTQIVGQTGSALSLSDSVVSTLVIMRELELTAEVKVNNMQSGLFEHFYKTILPF